MIKLKNILVIFTCLVVQTVFSQTKVRNVTAEEFKKEIASGKSVLIDLRTNDEIKSKGTIKGVLQIDYLAKDAETVIEKLDRKKSYLVFCAGGGRSSDCAELMTKLGFSEVVNLEKGFDDWKKKGYEIETK